MSITVERLVHADVDDLWGYLGRVEDWADLLLTVDHVALASGDPIPAVGSCYALRQPGLPRLVYKIAEWVPGQRFTWVAALPGVRTIGRHEISRTPDGSLLRLTLEWHGLLRPLVALLYTSRTRRYVELEADTFVQLAERHNSP